MFKILKNMAEMSSTSFEIVLDERPKRPHSGPPKRFLTNKARTPLTKQQLDEKQVEADARRKAQEEEKLKRMHERQEECLKLNSNVEKLLQLDAKRSGAPGLMHVKPMSNKQVKETVRQVAKSMDKMGVKLQNDTTVPF
ncbi:unnamed protein product [Owenia fusiformis]|uniref:Uncharacterized protein n=1 Tax=Owenia fusiformis TaxID=6347 RepID=A0A8S4NIB3_OWEFU|nr:unnamed protein product [Owenia fusiformis]